MMNLWNNVGNENNTEKKEVKYLKFPEGSTVIRVLDEAPYTRWQHWLPAPANGGKGVGIDCIGKECPVCQKIAMEKAKGTPKEQIKLTTKKVHSINVLVRKPNGEDELNVLEQGNGLFGNLKDVMVMMGSAGMTPDLRKMDVMINRTGTGFNNTKYSVMPLMNKVSDLTEKELSLEKYNLQELKPKLNPEQIVQVMNGATLESVTKTEDNNQTENKTVEIDFSQGIV